MSFRVFVNNKAVEVEPGATAADAVLAAGLSAGPPARPTAMLVTDARGIEISLSSILGPGSILRVIPRRQEPDADA